MIYLKGLLFFPAVIFFYQLYRYASTRDVVQKESSCYGLGIAYIVLGVFTFIFRDLFFSLLGLLLLMLGLLLLAAGLQRKDKKIFIDRYSDDDEEK